MVQHCFGIRWWTERGGEPRGWCCGTCHPPDHLKPEQVCWEPPPEATGRCCRLRAAWVVVAVVETAPRLRIRPASSLRAEPAGSFPNSRDIRRNRDASLSKKCVAAPASPVPLLKSVIPPNWGQDGSSKCVVVHNDVETQRLALTALNSAGHEAIVFDDPMTALDALDGGIGPDLLITRANFDKGQDHGGATLARMVKLKCPACAVLFIALPENRPHVADAGEFLPLPVNREALIAAMERLLAK